MNEKFTAMAAFQRPKTAEENRSPFYGGCKPSVTECPPATRLLDVPSAMSEVNENLILLSEITGILEKKLGTILSSPENEQDCKVPEPLSKCEHASAIRDYSHALKAVRLRLSGIVERLQL